MCFINTLSIFGCSISSWAKNSVGFPRPCLVRISTLSKMADIAEIYHDVFMNSDSEAEFDGLAPEDLVALGAKDFPTFDLDQFDRDHEFPRDVALNWSREIAEPLVCPFTSNVGLNIDIDCDAPPEDYLSIFLKDDDYDNIALESNRYFEQVRASKPQKPFARMNSWYPAVGGEIRQMLGMTILMGLVDKPLLSSYWSTDSLDNTPYFSEHMTRDRFLNLLSFLHLTDNEAALQRGDPNYNPLYKAARRVWSSQVTAETRQHTVKPVLNSLDEEAETALKTATGIKCITFDLPDV